MRRWLWTLALCACDDGGTRPDPVDAAPDSAVRDAMVQDGDARRPDADSPDAAPADAAPDAAPDGAPLCNEGAVEVLGACGLNNRGERTQTCTDGAFVMNPCADPDVCVDDATRPADCPDGQGLQRCVAGQWGAIEGCESDLCPPRVELLMGAPWRGQLDGPGRWNSGCGGDGPEATARFTAPADATYQFTVTDAEFDTVLYLRNDCADADSATVCNDDADGARSVLPYAMQAGQAVTVVIDAFGEQESGAFTVEASRIVCAPGDEEQRRCEEPGALPAAQSRFCRADGWTEWSPCMVFGECVPGEVEVQARRCEDNRPGEQQRECDAEGQWSDWGACMPIGQCFQGAIEWEDCAVDGTQRTRTCGIDQQWGEWSDCAGATCPPLRRAELGTQGGRLGPFPSGLGNDCGDQNGSADTLDFTAPAAGSYAFWLQTRRPALSVRDACAEGDSSLACDTYLRPAFEYRPENASITLPLEADQSVTLLAGAEEQPGPLGFGYLLNIDHRDPAACEDEPVDNHHWSTALMSDAAEEAFGGGIGLLSADQCADQSDWFVADVPMGCNLMFTPLRVLYGQAAVGIRRPDGVIARDSGLLGPFSRVIGASTPGTWRVFIEANGSEPQTLVSTGVVCGRRTTRCSLGDDNVANNDPDAPAPLVARTALSEPICGGDIDHFEWAQGPDCHSRLTMACDLATVADLTVDLTDADGEPIPAEQVRAEPGLGPYKAGWVVDRPPGSDLTRLRMLSQAMDADGRCDLRVDEICFDQPCRGVGYVVGDYGLFADTLCDDGQTSLNADVGPGCELRVERIGGEPVQLTVLQAGMPVANGADQVAFTPDTASDLTVQVTGPPGGRYVLDGGVRCP